MLTNKLILETQNAIKEEQGLKLLEFATEYYCKKAEYRLLNPLAQTINFDMKSREDQCQVMAELSKLATETKNKNTISQSKAQKSHSPKKFSTFSKQQYFDFEEFCSHPKGQVLMQSVNKSALSHSSAGSKKSRKFQKPQKAKLEKSISDNRQKEEKAVKSVHPNAITPNFKKQKGTVDNEATFKELQIRKIHSGSENSQKSSSFDDLPFQMDSNIGSGESSRSGINLDSFNSYHSSQPSRGGNYNEKPFTRVLEVDSAEEVSRIQSKVNSSNQSILSEKEIEEIGLHRGKVKDQEKVSKQQIHQYLLKLETLEVQQQMIVKSMHKMWSHQREFKTLTKLQNLKFKDLELPKPSFRYKTIEFAKIIQ